MNGIDIASYQKDMDITKVDADFVIIKITQGDYYVNPSFDKHYNEAKRSSKLIGAYHYSNGLDINKEVDHLYKNLFPYLGNLIVCLDWESNGNTLKSGFNKEFKVTSEANYVLNFANALHTKTGMYPFVYMSASVTRRSDWKEVAKICPLWVAQYKNYDITGYQENPFRDSKGLGVWQKEAIRQYTPSGSIKGYEQTKEHKLDLDKAYISKEEWISFTKRKEETKKVTPEVVKDVLSGKYGSGLIRRDNLEKAGYTYSEVQGKINEVLDLKKKYNEIREQSGAYFDIVVS